MAISVLKAVQVAQAAVLILFVCTMPLCFGNMGAPELRTANGKLTMKGSNGPMEMEEIDAEVCAKGQNKLGFDEDCGVYDAVPAKLPAPIVDQQQPEVSELNTSCKTQEDDGSSALDPPCEEVKGGLQACLPFFVAFLAGGFFCLDVFEMMPVF
eukprot:gnl/MRDRNA2_/MRDRNA2_100598_c0_seq1.p1 gnl/MRDRNA2_/MRDRNA2_100598_c0~~gnl/MRDRNA2_/MRDRNA2_100598_c0_seq1.p1  ORF type:complete len:154 (-),score=41.96 gnl/MRDRNA2_/MRDRNA2_100598_c0_seq1:28-489(-)